MTWEPTLRVLNPEYQSLGLSIAPVVLPDLRTECLPCLGSYTKLTSFKWIGQDKSELRVYHFFFPTKKGSKPRKNGESP